MNRYDPSGHAWDVILDIGFIIWDIYNLCANKGYKDWENWAALGVDVAFAALPFVTGGGGQVVKVANVTDDIMDIKKVTVIGESMDRVKDTAALLDKLDNLYGGFKYYDSFSSFGKVGDVLGNVVSKIDNATWLYQKLRTGYKVVDIGIDLSKTARSGFYIVEKAVAEIWRFRNIWKWGYHIF